MTREEDLIRIAKKLDKMVSRNNTEGAMDLLKELKGFSMTLKLLQETRIGMSVNSIRKHCTDEEVIALAKVLIKEWKTLLDAGRRHNDKAAEVKNGLASSKTAGSPHSSPRKDSLDSKMAKKQLVEAKKERKNSCDSKLGQAVKRHSTDAKPDRKGKSEPPKTPTTPTSPMSPAFTSAGGPLPPHLTTGDSIRDKCIEMLAAALRTDNDFKDFGTNCDSMAAEIEDHIYQEMKATDMKYKNRVRSRISNLKDPKNPGLRRNVLAGSIDLIRIATMTSEEMASDELKQLRNVLTQEAIREHQMAKTGGTTTDLLQCGKCKKKNCTYNQVQTRSADEPMTTFVLCNECGNRWKFC
uniref:transcription elongation factor A protein 3 isoform X2 n=1 Tax=Doryrhamphus excisus TaxID=161450 RepID=UPI0025AE0018|nr:transcription elongation factor A protein 3 isoform X2 [Doryrhamphus excisus]